MKKTAVRRVMWIALGIALAAVVLVIALATGLLSGGAKVEPGRVFAPREGEGEVRTARAAKEDVPVWYETVGTVESQTTANVAARIAAAVVSVAVDAGARVAQGDVLAVLDDRELEARKSQAEAARAASVAGLRESERALEAAEALFAQSKAAYDRTKGFHQEKVATDAELEAAEAQYRQAQAGAARAQAGIERAKGEVDRAEQALREAEVALGYTRVVSPLDGEVARRLVDPGDLAWPGKTLVVVHDRNRLRLRAAVREGLWGQIAVGHEARVAVPALGETFDAKIEEVEPAADPRSRSFTVKLPLPQREGLYPGMFGRLRVRLGTRPAVLVPEEAIVRVGQLTAVIVRSGGEWRQRQVRTGPAVEDRVEILTGLDGGEEVKL